MTTDSNHGWRVYPNLARTMVLTGVDQLWVANLTYIRLSEEFVFLAVILDAYSRRVIGWALDRTLEGKLTLAALQMALSLQLFPLRNVYPLGSVSVPAATRQQVSTTATALPRAIVTCDAYSIRLPMPEPGPKEAFLRLSIADWCRVSDIIKQSEPLPIDSAA